MGTKNDGWEVGLRGRLLALAANGGAGRIRTTALLLTLRVGAFANLPALLSHPAAGTNLSMLMDLAGRYHG